MGCGTANFNRSQHSSAKDSRPGSPSPTFIAFAMLVTLPRTPGAFMNVEKGHTGGLLQNRLTRLGVAFLHVYDYLG
jgi:hypothetical protein